MYVLERECDPRGRGPGTARAPPSSRDTTTTAPSSAAAPGHTAALNTSRPLPDARRTRTGEVLWSMAQPFQQSFHLRRDSRGSIAYSEELISSTISVTLQSTDRHHGIV